MTPTPGTLAAQEAARLSREATVSPKAAEAVLNDLERRIDAILPWGDDQIAGAKARAAADRRKWTADARAALGSAYPLLACLPQSYERADVPKLAPQEQARGGWVVVASIWTLSREGWNYDTVPVSGKRHASREAALAEIEIIRSVTLRDEVA